MASKREQVIGGVLTALETNLTGVLLERNATRPMDLDDIPHGGHVILRDGETETIAKFVGTTVKVMAQHCTLEVYVPAGNEHRRDTLLESIGAILSADPGFGGLVEDLTVGEIAFDVTDEAGIPEIPAALVPLTLEYETSDLLG